MEEKIFLEAQWRKLILANYAVNPEILMPYVPAGTALDLWEDTCYVSLVGFMFLDVRLLGFPIPFHRNFEEVNLRFYVRRTDSEGDIKRGVVFVREIVPKPALSLVANTIYGEHYRTMPMRHSWVHSGETQTISYSWKKKTWHSLEVKTSVEQEEMAPGSEAEFITEHYWGYVRQNARKSSAYQVEHPRWKTYPVLDYNVEADFGMLYGPEFGFLSGAQPRSVMLAEGSPIVVRKGVRL